MPPTNAVRWSSTSRIGLHLQVRSEDSGTHTFTNWCWHCSISAGDGLRHTSGPSPTRSQDGLDLVLRMPSNTSISSPGVRSRISTLTPCGCRIEQPRKRLPAGIGTPTDAAIPLRGSDETEPRPISMAAPTQATWCRCLKPTTNIAELLTPQQCRKVWLSFSSTWRHLSTE